MRRRAWEYEERRREAAVALSRDPAIYDRLVRPFAPSIW